MWNTAQPFFAALFIALLAQVNIEVPFNDIQIPITGQSFAVLLVAALLGKNKGTLAIFIYLLLGVIGLPVFAKAASGYSVFLKGSGGYLYGFLIAGFVVGWMAEKGWGQNFFRATGMMLIGTLIILFFGIFHLTILYGFQKALEYGLYPFIGGAIIKILLGAAVLQLFSLSSPRKNNSTIEQSI